MLAGVTSNDLRSCESAAHACTACVRSNRDSLDDSPFQTACDAYNGCMHRDSIDDVTAGTDTGCSACELATGEPHDWMMIEDSTAADSACNACFLRGPLRDSLMDQSDPTTANSNSNSNSRGNACMLPNRSSLDSATETGRHSFENTRNQDSLMDDIAEDNACDACMLPHPPATILHACTVGTSPLGATAPSNVSTEEFPKRVAQLYSFCGVGVPEDQLSGLCSFPGRHTSEV